MALGITRSVGMLLLAIYLILSGLLSLVGFGGLGIVLPVLALLAGIFILVGR